MFSLFLSFFSFYLFSLKIIKKIGFFIRILHCSFFEVLFLNFCLILTSLKKINIYIYK